MASQSNRLVRILQLSRQAFWHYKWQIVVLIILGFVGGLLEGIGVNALVPLFTFVLKDQPGANDWISRSIENAFNYFHVPYSLTYIVILIALLFLGKAIISLALNYIRVKITSDYEETTKQRLLRKVLFADWPYLMKQKLGHLDTILLLEIPSAAQLLAQISNSVIVGTSLVIYIVIALNISFITTLIVLAVGGIIFLVFKPLNYRIKILAYQRTDLNKQIAHYVSENVLGLKTVKAMQVENMVSAQSSKFFSSYRDNLVRLGFYKMLSSSIIQPLGIIVICAIFAVSYKSADFNVAAFAAVIYLVERIFSYIQQLQRNLHGVNDLIPQVVSVLEYEKEATSHKEVDSGSKGFVFKKELTFENVNFYYDQGRPVHKSLSFSVAKGELVGIIGPSGTGKTTLVDLILRLLEPQDGRIAIDGIDIREINIHDWRKGIGYVSQDIFLTNDTVANNIRFYDNALSNKDIKQAAAMANILDFINNSPDKFETVIGERGMMLSAGQRQRIVIARILARSPKLLILDEATSALDNESEAAVQEVIKNLKGRVTVLSIAHRLSSIVDFDRVLVLDQGKIAEEGPPEKLLADQRSYFYKVYNLKRS